MQKEIKHTPGPWHVGAGNGHGSIFADIGRMRYEGTGTALYPVCSVNYGYDDAEDSANANLIASAPDLLCMLQRVLDEVCMSECGMSHIAPLTLKQARTALSKAKGEN